MLFHCLTLFIAIALGLAENDRRRIEVINEIASCRGNPFCVIAKSGGGGKRRRRFDGQYVDTVCTRTMGIVRQTPYLRELLTEEGADNMRPLDKALEEVEEMCTTESTTTDAQMNQCAFYVRMARQIDEEFTGGFWLNAYGSVKDQMHGCGAVVNMVNSALGRFGAYNVRRAEVDGHEIYVTKEDNSLLRRLVGAGVMGAGAYLAHVCRSFDENNNLITADL